MSPALSCCLPVALGRIFSSTSPPLHLLQGYVVVVMCGRGQSECSCGPFWANFHYMVTKDCVELDLTHLNSFPGLCFFMSILVTSGFEQTILVKCRASLTYTEKWFGRHN